VTVRSTRLTVPNSNPASWTEVDWPLIEALHNTSFAGQHHKFVRSRHPVRAVAWSARSYGEQGARTMQITDRLFISIVVWTSIFSTTLIVFTIFSL
jgi:hypothetical protein